MLRCYHNIRDTSPDIQNTYKSINIQYLSDVWYIFSQNSRFLNAFLIFSNIFECLHAFLWIIQYFLYFPHRIIEFWSSAAEAAACKCAAARLSNSPYASFHTNTSIWKQCEKERERGRERVTAKQGPLILRNSRDRFTHGMDRSLHHTFLAFASTHTCLNDDHHWNATVRWPPTKHSSRRARICWGWQVERERKWRWFR